MTKTVSTSKKPRKQHSPEFRSEALKLAERIGVTAAARELSLYESQLYNWRSKQQNQQTSSERELEMSTEIARLKRVNATIFDRLISTELSGMVSIRSQFFHRSSLPPVITRLCL